MATTSLKRSLLPTGLAAAVLLLPGPVHAGFRIAPYLQDLTESSIIIRWETETPERGRVEYGHDPRMGLHREEAGVSTGHSIQLAPLDVDTLYHYRVVSGRDTVISAFRTMVREGRPFRFLVYGDNRSDSVAHTSVVEAMARVTHPAPVLLLNTGDLTASGSAGELRTFFAIEGPLLRRVPVYPCMGNHDVTDLASYTACFPFPNNGRWYSVRYRNVAFHALDITADISPSSEQYLWFRRSLRADSADAGIRHIVVWFHNPPYTTNTAHMSDSLAQRMICPLLERFGVRLAFHGHNHCYEHSLVNGVHYVISGGGGAPLYKRWNPPEAWTVARNPTYEFVQVDVDGDTMKVVALKPDGAVIDSFRVLSAKSGPAPTGGAGIRGRSKR